MTNIDENKFKYSMDIILRPLMKCNWDCYYCGFNKNSLTSIEHIDEAFTLKMIKYMFKKYPDKGYTISGGEPGLLSKSFFESIISYIKEFEVSKCTLETNGTVFRHDLDFGVFSKIRYHAIEDISKNDNIKYQNLSEDWNIEFITIFTKSLSLVDFENHIRKYSHIYKKRVCNIKPELELLKNYSFVFKLIKFIIDMRKEDFKLSFRYVKTLSKISQKDRKLCMANPRNIDISFSTNYIAKCCYYSFLADNDFPITEKNIDSVINGDFIVDHPYCQKCDKLANIYRRGEGINTLTELL